MEKLIKNGICFLVAFISYLGVYSQPQTTLVLQPDSAAGKDAFIRDLIPTENWGRHPEFAAIAWTNLGRPVVVRSVLDFDLSSVPENAIIDSAKLYLYAFNSSANFTHSTSSGSNEAKLRRITSTWDEMTVNWDNQPSTSLENEVTVPASNGPLQHYKLDVTNLVQDMIDDPLNSYGFFFELVTEQYYRRLVFASSDNPDAEIRPKLVVTYKIAQAATSLDEIESTDFNLYPNPADGSVRIDVQNLKQTTVDVKFFNILGQKVKSLSAVPVNSELNLSGLAVGMYVVKVYVENGVIISKKLEIK